MLIRLFRKAGATGHVFYLKKGRAADKGLAYSGLVGPTTTVAVVPGVDQVCPVSLDAKSSDKQDVSASGEVTIAFDAAKALRAFDFTVDLASGGYVGNWQAVLQQLVNEQVMGTLRAKLKGLKTEDAVSAQAQLEEAIAKALAADTPAGKVLAQKGVRYVSCSMAEVAPQDEDVAGALGVKEREAMLAEADDARHERRMDAAENERTIKTYEAATVLTLENEKAKLVIKQGQNEQEKAKFDALASTARLAPFAKAKPGAVLVASVMKMAERGVTSLTISPELLAAIKQGK